MMDTYSKRVMEAINQHYVGQSYRKPVAMSTREEMDNLFFEGIPEEPKDPMAVLDFILENVMTKSTIVSHPKAYSFVPVPSNFIGAMGDALASGFNIFSGGRAASPAGGIDLKQINFKSFESRVIPGMYIAGEILNIDAITGASIFRMPGPPGF